MKGDTIHRGSDKGQYAPPGSARCFKASQINGNSEYTVSDGSLSHPVCGTSWSCAPHDCLGGSDTGQGGAVLIGIGWLGCGLSIGGGRGRGLASDHDGGSDSLLWLGACAIGRRRCCGRLGHDSRERGRSVIVVAAALFHGTLPSKQEHHLGVGLPLRVQLGASRLAAGRAGHSLVCSILRAAVSRLPSTASDSTKVVTQWLTS